VGAHFSPALDVEALSDEAVSRVGVCKGSLGESLESWRGRLDGASPVGVWLGESSGARLLGWGSPGVGLSRVGALQGWGSPGALHGRAGLAEVCGRGELERGDKAGRDGAGPGDLTVVRRSRRQRPLAAGRATWPAACIAARRRSGAAACSSGPTRAGAGEEWARAGEVWPEPRGSGYGGDGTNHRSTPGCG
jgi:hypothetical protein